MGNPLWRRRARGAVGVVVFLLASLLAPREAAAVPAFAAQTGQPCAACHIGAFGPQLTPIGREFKLGGYTQTGGEGIAAQIPLALEAITSFNNTAKSLPQDQKANRYDVNNNFNFDQLMVYLAGGFGEHSGAFIQFTAQDNLSTLYNDNTDIRPYVTTFDLGDTELTVGSSINNSPTMQDVWNTTPVWSYPYVSSGLAPGPTAAPVLDGAFSHDTIGASVYAWYDHHLYVEGGLYKSKSSWLNVRLGDEYGVGRINGVAPYVRLAYQWEWKNHAAHVGALYMHSNVAPLSGPWSVDNSFGNDHYADYLIDASYFYLDGDGKHRSGIQGSFTHEDESFNGTGASFNNANGTSFGNRYWLEYINANICYWYENTYGVVLGWQKTWGPANPYLYAPAEVYGSNNNKPNSNSFSIEADWVPFGKEKSWLAPFVNLKLGVQYVAYTEFNGGNKNYDGFGRKASDNNTLFAFAWLAF